MDGFFVKSLFFVQIFCNFSKFKNNQWICRLICHFDFAASDDDVFCCDSLQEFNKLRQENNYLRSKLKKSEQELEDTRGSLIIVREEKDKLKKKVSVFVKFFYGIQQFQQHLRIVSWAFQRSN